MVQEQIRYVQKLVQQTLLTVRLLCSVRTAIFIFKFFLIKEFLVLILSYYDNQFLHQSESVFCLCVRRIRREVLPSPRIANTDTSFPQQKPVSGTSFLKKLILETPLGKSPQHTQRSLMPKWRLSNPSRAKVGFCKHQVLQVELVFVQQAPSAESGKFSFPLPSLFFLPPFFFDIIEGRRPSSL